MRVDSGSLLRSVLGGYLQGLMIAWPVWLVFGGIFVAKVAIRIREKRRLAASGIAEIDQMEGRTFEKYLEVLFQRLGYAVELTRAHGDYGADLVVRRDGVTTVIQAKRHQRSVGVKAVQEAVAAKGLYSCTAAMVVTNSTYTKQAVILAQANGVILWDRDQLVAALLSVKGDAAPASTAALVSPRPAVPPSPAATPLRTDPPMTSGRCATCAKTVSPKVLAYCTAHSERLGGMVYCYDHQRTATRHTTGAGSPR